MDDRSGELGWAATHEVLTEDEWEEVRTTLELSPRELEVVQLLFDGLGESGVAYAMGVTPGTVHTFIRRIYAKNPGVSDHRELVIRVFEEVRKLSTG